MKKIFCLLFISTLLPTPKIFSDEIINEPSVNQNEKLQWEKKLDAAKSSRSVLFVSGIGGVIGGLIVYANGLAENNSAGDVPGCQRDGTSVLCDTEDHTTEAQDKIDSGLIKMAAGIIVTLGGGILTGFGIRQHHRVKALEAEGKQKGFAWDIRIKNSEEAILAFNYSF